MRTLLICVWFTVALARGATTVVEETFPSDPSNRGWRLFGNSELFRWNPTTEALDVTWDSRHPNSFFYRPLHTILTPTDDFSLEFDLWLDNITLGIDPTKPYTFQIAVGLIRLENAKGFLRGSGINAQTGPRNLVEFNYFPDSGFGATVAPTVASANNRIAFSDNHPLELDTGHWFRVTLAYTASNQARAAMRRDALPFGLPPQQTLAELPLSSFPGFRVDTLAIASYSDAGQTPPQFAGSVLAHGTVDNLRLTHPPLPFERLRSSFSTTNCEVSFLSSTGWIYRLERTTNLLTWSSASPVIPGTGLTLRLRDNSGSVSKTFYRLWADRP